MRVQGTWLGASMLALVWSAPALAQVSTATRAGSPESQTSSTGETSPENQQATPGDQADVGSDEVVVTATRRTERLMSAPVSASVLSGDQLGNKGVANVDALQFAMPSVVVNNFGQGNNFNVRGIGKGEHNTQTTTGVITYRDGVPTFPGYFQGEPYFDVANIQVLRGPQGTIVGQNATGGAVFVNTNDPIIGGGVHGYAQVNYGNYNDLGGQGAINLPISDTLAARAAFYGERRDSFYKITGPNGGDYPYNKGDLRMIAGRFSLLWKPVEGLSILSKTDFDYLDFGAYVATPYANNLDTIPGTGTPNPNSRDLFDASLNAPQEARDKFLRTVLKIEYDFDGGTKLRSITGFQNGNTRYRADLDGTASDTAGAANTAFFDSVTETQFSQEVNIISPDTGRFTWLAGAFGVWNTYFFLKPYQFVIDVAYPFDLAAAQYRLQGRNPERSLALFGQVAYEITPTLKVDLGGRYTASRSINHVDILQYGTPLRTDQETRSDNFSYKATLGWKASPDHYLYGFVATGFRPGGLNTPVGLGDPAPFEPEKVTSYEIGWKANLVGGKLRTTVSGFYNRYKDFQVTIGYPQIPTFGIELNVDDPTEIYGFEAEADLTLGRLKLDAGINVLHSSLGRFFATDPRSASLAPCDPETGPASTTCLALEGRRQTYAPDFTFNIGAEYTIDVGASDKLTPRVNFGHVGNQYATLFGNEARGDLLEPRNILNAQVAYTHDSWTLTAYGTNLTDQHYPGALNSNLYFAGPPRQYGVKLLKTF